MTPSSFWMTFGPLFAINTYVVAALVTFSFIYKKRPRTKEVEERHSSVILNKWIREFWMWLTQPLYTFFIYFKVTPNTISFMGTVMALFSGFAFVFRHVGLAGWLMVLGASLDFFDGRIARATNQCTKAGSFFDSSMDRVSEGITLTGIAFYYKDCFIFWVVMAAYLGAMLTSYTKAKGETMGVDYSGGMMQRPERLAYLGAGGILTPMLAFFLHSFATRFFPLLSYDQLEGYIYFLPLAFVAVFCSFAAYNRITNIMKILTKNETMPS